MLAIGTSVRAVNQPATTGWSGEELLVNVFPSHSQVEEIANNYRVTSEPAQGVDRLVQTEAGSFGDFVDWSAVRRAANQRNGVTASVATRSAMARNSAPADNRAATRAYDNPGSAQRYYERETPRSPYPAPPPYPSYPYYGSDTPQSYYGQDLAPPSQGYPYYGNGALRQSYQRPAYQPYDPRREA